MNLGDRLRQLRQAKNLTQPELAEAMGIEQSYLSKLENGKSLPSADMLARILDVFGLEIGDLVDDLDQGVRNQLRQIPDVAQHFAEQKRLMIGDRRRWLLISTVLLAVGAAMIYAGTVELVAPRRVFTYTSLGVVRPGESREIFEEEADDSPELAARIDQDYFVTRYYRGDTFIVSVDGGTRTYSLTDVYPNAVAWQNQAVATVGVLLLVLGVTGIVLEKKLSRFQ